MEDFLWGWIFKSELFKTRFQTYFGGGNPNEDPGDPLIMTVTKTYEFLAKKPKCYSPNVYE
jgi:hypothetical protein